MTSILTLEHPRWDEFIEALNYPGVVFDYAHHLRPQGHHDWNFCKSDFRHAEEIMNRMGGIDIAGSLAFFRQHGAHCDCEIVLDQSEHILCPWEYDPHWGTPEQRSRVAVHASSLGLSQKDGEWPAQIETTIGDAGTQRDAVVDCKG
jgi:hypothetical protein